MLGTNEHAQYRNVTPKLMSKCAVTVAFPDCFCALRGRGGRDSSRGHRTGECSEQFGEGVWLDEKTLSEGGGHEVTSPVMSLSQDSAPKRTRFVAFPQVRKLGFEYGRFLSSNTLPASQGHIAAAWLELQQAGPF